MNYRSAYLVNLSHALKYSDTKYVMSDSIRVNIGFSNEDKTLYVL